MAQVHLKNITKTYGSGAKSVAVILGISIDIDDGEFVVMVGPSGCGKSTLLRMVAGLEEITGGDIVIGDRVVNQLEPKDRDIAMVFQNYALYPHMSVADNMGFALKIGGSSKTEIRERVTEAAKILDLEDYLDRKPKALSGGQRQRVAMGRAIVRSPQVFLMDEPLSNLDAKLRQDVRVEIRELQRKLGLTTVMVTHDQEEALTMADRLVVMSEGRIRQIGTQQDLYERPADRFVADFVGRSTFIEGRVEAPGRFVSEGGLALACEADSLGPASLALRPERIALLGRDTTLDNTFEGMVEFVSYLGAQVDVHVRLTDKERAVVQIANHPDRAPPVVGERVRIGWTRATAHVFPAGSPAS